MGTGNKPPSGLQYSLQRDTLTGREAGHDTLEGQRMTRDVGLSTLPWERWAQIQFACLIRDHIRRDLKVQMLLEAFVVPSEYE